MRRTRRAASTCAAVALVLLGPAAFAADVTTTAGKKLTGKLVAVDGQGVTVSTPEAKVTIPARDVVVVDLGPRPPDLPPKQFAEIELTDGSTIRAAKYALRGKRFELEQLPAPEGQPAPEYTLPMGAVFSAVKKAEDPKLREAWKKMLAARGKRDLYVIQQDAGFTFVQGTVIEGLEQGGALRLRFEKEDGGKDLLLQSRAAGLVFYQPQPAAVPPTLCLVRDAYGNKLTAAAVALADGGATVTTVSGATVKYPSLAGLARFEFELGNVAYLSDLAPQVEAPELPADEKKFKLNPTAAVTKDRSLSNEPIKLDNVTFPKGLVVAPDTVLTFNIGGDYAQFKATVGIDENGANATSAAKVTVEADGQVVFAKTVRRKERGEGVVLGVKGVKQLRLIVETDTPLNGNYVTFAEARVQK
jgi:hypothetical protein